jgi:hypothetical protein
MIQNATLNKFYNDLSNIYYFIIFFINIYYMIFELLYLSFSVKFLFIIYKLLIIIIFNFSNSYI